MKSLRSENIKQELLSSFIEFECEVPSFFFKNLKSDIINVMRKYADFDENNLLIKVKVLKGNKYIFMIDCLSDSIVINNNL